VPASGHQRDLEQTLDVQDRIYPENVLHAEVIPLTALKDHSGKAPGITSVLPSRRLSRVPNFSRLSASLISKISTTRIGWNGISHVIWFSGAEQKVALIAQLYR